MAKRVLTDRAIKALKPASAGGSYDVPDALVPGLIVRVTATGRKTFALLARYPGRKHPTRRDLGLYGAITLEEARETARQWHALIRRGIDPKEEADATRRAAERRRADTVDVLVADYARDYLADTRTGIRVERSLRFDLLGQTKTAAGWSDDPERSAWRGRPVTEIQRADVVNLVRDIKRRGSPGQARIVLSAMRTMFDWAVEHGTYGIETSPCASIRAAMLLGTKPIRQRILNDDEMRACWLAAGDLGYPFGPFVRVLMLTVQREAEVAGMPWSELDFGRALWTVPPERMKADAPHLVPLSPEVVAILGAEDFPRWTGGDCVFSTLNGERPVSGFSKVKRRLDGLMLARMQKAAEERGDDPEKVKLAPWTFHDLRRTGRTHFSAIPSTDIVRELTIAHTQKGLHKVYDQWAYLDERRALLDRWAKRLMAIVEPPQGNVVKLAERK